MSGNLIFGQDRTNNTLHSVAVDSTGVVAVDVHGGATGSGDIKARTDIANPATSTFLKCDADGKLEIEATLELDESGLAKEITLAAQSAKLPTSLGQKANSGSLSTTRSSTVGAYDMSGRTTIGTAGTSTKLLCDALGKLQVDVVGGAGGDATAANQATQILEATDINTAVTSLDNKITSGADTTLLAAQQVLCYGEVTSGPGTGELHPIHITNAGDVEVEIADFVKGQEIMAASFPVVIASDQSTLNVAGTVAVSGGNISVTGTVSVPGVATETTLSALNTKVTNGSDMVLASAQQVLSYGCDFNGDLRPLKLGTTGRLIVEVDGIRANGSQLGWTIANNATANSNEILMNTHTRIAFYGDTNNTFNANFFIEYSQDGVSWFRGSDANAKVIIISATGNFYDEEIITPPRVRLSRTNNSGALETVNLYWTQL